MCQGTNKLGSVTAVTWVIVKDVGKLADVTDQHDRNDIWRRRKEGRGHNDEKTKTTSTTVMKKMSSMSLINGDDLFLSTLTVVMFPLIPLVNPNMVFSPPNEIYFQNVGDTVKLNCSAGGAPLPRVKWLGMENVFILQRYFISTIWSRVNLLFVGSSQGTLQSISAYSIMKRMWQRKPTQVWVYINRILVHVTVKGSYWENSAVFFKKLGSVFCPVQSSQRPSRSACANCCSRLRSHFCLSKLTHLTSPQMLRS